MSKFVFIMFIIHRKKKKKKNTLNLNTKNVYRKNTKQR